MVIEYIKLENFANIYSSFKTKMIEIDFSKRKNKITLITGPNGSGKTSILSTLHPFANNGNLDVRSEMPLIRIGEPGYKEIHISNGDDYYIIKHFYQVNKQTHSIKSYITKNDVELNPNGNVRSFKELVNTELDIEPDYLKLIRLGNNVTNFIDLKSLDRKAFMGQIISEIDIYLKYFQKVNNKMRETRSVVSHLVDKIDKLSISDIDEMKKSQKDTKKQLDSVVSELETVKESLNIVNYKLEQYDSPLTINEAISDNTKTLNKISKTISKYSDKELSTDEYKKKAEKVKETISKLNLQYTTLDEKLVNTLNSHDELLKELKSVTHEIKKGETNSDITSLEKIISDLKATIESRVKEHKLIDYKPPCTKDEVNDLLVTLDNCRDIMSTTYEFGIDVLKKACEYISSGISISSYINDTQNKHQKNKLQAMCEYVYNKFVNLSAMNNLKCNDVHCPALKFYHDIADMATEIPDVVVEDETFVTYTKFAYQNIRTVIDKIKEHKDILHRMPEEIQNMFLIENMIKRILVLKPFYDRDKIYSIASQITEYDLYQSDLEKLSGYKDKLTLLKSAVGNLDYFYKKKKDLVSSIDDKSEQIEDIRSNLEKVSSELRNLTEECDDLQELIISLERRDDIKSDLDDLIKSYEAVKLLEEQKSDIQSTLSKLEHIQRKLQADFNTNDYRIKSYESMTKELGKYRKIYDEMELVRRSLSSKEGIPLFYQQIYLKDVQTIANELLDVVYDGELYIDKFEPTADDFKIPFVANDTVIADVSHASQGERSFISLALSFALIYHALSKYNIVLLDEIDATLDTCNREKFIQILERQLDMINGEQIFLISHNNMFSTYPVDVIDTKNHVDSENTLANYIKINIE